MKGGPQTRVSSPSPGFSTLITSAPRSARICVAHGPASTRERSRTRICLSGPAICFPSFAPCENGGFTRHKQSASNASLSSEGDAGGGGGNRSLHGDEGAGLLFEGDDRCQ